MPASVHHLHTHHPSSPFFLPHPNIERLEVRSEGKRPALSSSQACGMLLCPTAVPPKPFGTWMPRPREGKSLLKGTL